MSNRNVFIASDPHFYHPNVLKFQNADGSKQRPEFVNINHMNDYIIDSYNSVVKPQDKLIILGDIAMKPSGVDLLAHVNGEKILVRGNHDTAKLEKYCQYFSDIKSEHRLRLYNGLQVVLTHRPILMYDEKIAFNVHGHTHSKHIPDWRYYNVCPEVVGYTPLNWNDLHSELAEIFKKRGNNDGI